MFNLAIDNKLRGCDVVAWAGQTHSARLSTAVGSVPADQCGEFEAPIITGRELV